MARYTLDEFVNQMPIYQDIEKIKPNMLEIAAMAKVLIKEGLKSQLGSKANHISVGFIKGTPDYASISYQAHDKVGSILLTGAEPHTIEGDPLRFEKEGAIIFATRVDHPGFEGIKDDVDRIVQSALSKAVAMVL